MSFRIKQYADELNNRRQQILNLLNEINNTLHSLIKLVELTKGLAEEYGIQLPKYSEDLTVKELNPEYLKNLKIKLINYSKDIIFFIISKLMPGLVNDINECSAVEKLCGIDINALRKFINNVKELWNYHNELKYLRPCFKGYCDFIDGIINDKYTEVLKHIVKTIKNIDERFTEAMAIPYIAELKQCVHNDIINNKLKSCDLGSFLKSLNDAEKIIDDVISTLTYLNTITDIINEVQTPNLQYNHGNKYSENCIKVINILDKIYRTIKELNFRDIMQSIKCNTLDELNSLDNAFKSRIDQYLGQIRKVSDNVLKYLDGFEKLLNNEIELQNELKGKRDSLENVTERLISGLSSMNVNRDYIKNILIELGNRYQDIANFLCMKLMPQLESRLSNEEIVAIIKLIDNGGKIDFKELSIEDRQVFIRLCEKEILKCEVSLG